MVSTRCACQRCVVSLLDPARVQQQCIVRTWPRTWGAAGASCNNTSAVETLLGSAETLRVAAQRNRQDWEAASRTLLPPMPNRLTKPSQVASDLGEAREPSGVTNGDAAREAEAAAKRDARGDDAQKASDAAADNDRRDRKGLEVNGRKRAEPDPEDATDGCAAEDSDEEPADTEDESDDANPL